MLVSVTRLRIRSLRFMPAFFVHAQRATAQIRRAEGFLDGLLLPDRKLTFWTMTLWRDLADMRRYMTDGAHLKVMPKLLHWCDEASVVHWTQEAEALPDWAEADRRMRSEGRPSKVRHPSPHHGDLSYRSPRAGNAAPIRSRSL